jgi:hypothetical protein
MMNNINKCLLKSEVDYQRTRRQAQVEIGSTKVQAVEGAPTGRHLLQTLPSLSITLFLFIRLDPNED